MQCCAKTGDMFSYSVSWHEAPDKYYILNHEQRSVIAVCLTTVALLVVLQRNSCQGCPVIITLSAPAGFATRLAHSAWTADPPLTVMTLHAHVEYVCTRVCTLLCLGISTYSTMLVEYSP